MFRLRIALPAVAAFGLLTAACSKQTPGDAALAQAIKANLYSDAGTRSAAIGIAVAGGVVTLTGDVPSSDVELEAMKVANGTAGIRSVNDQMKVNAAATQLPDAGTPIAQGAAPVAALPAATAPAPSAAIPPPSKPSARTPAEIATAKAPVEPAPIRPVEPDTITVTAGNHVSVRTIEAIDSHTNQSGQSFRATLSSPVTTSEGRVVIPAGESAEIVLSDVKGAGRIKGNSELEVRLVRVSYRGQSYPVESSVYAAEGKGRGKSTAIKTGVGAAVGGLIGALAGGGKGAAIGSAAGGGAGFGTSLFTHGQQVKIPSESILTFRLEAPLVVNR